LPIRAPTRRHTGITSNAGPTKHAKSTVGPSSGRSMTWSAKYFTPASIVPIPAACTTKQASSIRNGRLPVATRSWARRLGSLSRAGPAGTPRVPTYAPTAPTTISAPQKSPIQRCPGMPSPPALTTSGATAPDTRIASARKATRQVIRRVRSVYPSVISAGIATYGTWKNANAVAVARNATAT
jgi:hypothetical protein